MGTTQGNKEKHSKLTFTLSTALGILQSEIPGKVITWHKAHLPLTIPAKSTLDPNIFKQKMSECKPGTACNGQCGIMILFSWVLPLVILSPFTLSFTPHYFYLSLSHL